MRLRYQLVLTCIYCASTCLPAVQGIVANGASSRSDNARKHINLQRRQRGPGGGGGSWGGGSWGGEGSGQWGGGDGSGYQIPDDLTGEEQTDQGGGITTVTVAKTVKPKPHTVTSTATKTAAPVETPLQSTANGNGPQEAISRTRSAGATAGDGTSRTLTEETGPLAGGLQSSIQPTIGSVTSSTLLGGSAREALRATFSIDAEGHTITIYQTVSSETEGQSERNSVPSAAAPVVGSSVESWSITMADFSLGGASSRWQLASEATLFCVAAATLFHLVV